MDEKLRDAAIFYEIRALALLDSLYLEKDTDEQKKVKEYALKLFEIVSQDDLRDYKSELDEQRFYLLGTGVLWRIPGRAEAGCYGVHYEKVSEISGWVKGGAKEEIFK